MKLPPFDYHRPKSLSAALELLAKNGDDARPLAGGQSMMPMMAFRLATPVVLVDLGGVPDLDAITVDSSGVHLGAMVRWRDLEEDKRLAAAQPMLAEAVPHIAHYQIRNRGTVGGSLANADPASELPGVAVACDATIEIASVSGKRTLPAGKLFLGPLTTSLATGEIITGIRFPVWPQGRKWSFLEFATHRGAFALAGVALWYDGDAKAARNVHIGVIGAASTPRRLPGAETALEGNAITEAVIRKASEAAAREVDPSDDIHAGADYRRALVGTLVERALKSTLA